MEMYSVSSKWDHIEHFSSLITNGSKFAYVDFDFKATTKDSIYSGICMYLPHKDGEEYTQIGVDHEGMYYNGDCYPAENDPSNLGREIHKLPVMRATMILEKWRNLLNASSEMESELISILGLDKDCVCVFLSNFHEERKK